MVEDIENLEYFEVPEETTELEDSLFTNCRKLKKVVLPEGLKRTGHYTFSGCWELEEINLPVSLMELGLELFKNCKKLKEIVIPKLVITVPPRCFFGCLNLTKVTLSVNIRRIDSQAFAYTGITKIKFSKFLNCIGKSAFESCKKLQEVTFSKVKDLYIWNRAFANCGLRKVQLPEGLARTYDKCFAGCEYLEELIFPASIEEIDHDPVEGCFNLKKIVLPIGIKFPFEYIDIIERTDEIFSRGVEYLNNCKSIGVELTFNEKLNLWNFYYVGVDANFNNFSGILLLKNDKGERLFNLFELEDFYEKHKDAIGYYGGDIKNCTYQQANQIIRETYNIKPPTDKETEEAVEIIDGMLFKKGA